MTPPFDDQPRVWNPEVMMEDEQPQSTEIMTVEETPLPTIAEQKDIIKESDISEENKGMLNALVEMNNVAQTLIALRSSETAEQRKTFLTAICENFVSARMRNNSVAEQLKAKLLERLLNNIENLDLETVSKIYTDLSEVSSVDSQQAIANINGGGSSGNTPGSGPTFNFAFGEGAQATSNTLAVGKGAETSVSHLKEVASMNNSLKAWGNIPTKKPIVVDAESVEKK